jgi:hypothetical protein
VRYPVGKCKHSRLAIGGTVLILYFQGFLQLKLMLSTGVDEAISSGLPEYSHPSRRNKDH